MKRRLWTWGLVSSAVIFLFLEIVGWLDGDPQTPTLTEAIVRNVPAAIGIGAAVAFARWVVAHFRDAYRDDGPNDG